MALTRPSADFVSTTLSGALAAAATTATVGTGLSIPATNSYLQIDYDSTTAVGSDNGPETVFYAAYNSGTGALTGMVRGQGGTTDVAHANGAKVQLGMSTEFLEGFVGARAYLNAAITTTVSGAITKVGLDTESYDIGANFASNKFVAPVDGYYDIKGQVAFDQVTAGNKVFGTYIYKNNASINYNTKLNAGASGSFFLNVADTVYLAKDDYVELFYFHNDATTVDILGGVAGTYLAVALLKEV